MPADDRGRAVRRESRPAEPPGAWQPSPVMSGMTGRRLGKRPPPDRRSPDLVRSCLPVDAIGRTNMRRDRMKTSILCSLLLLSGCDPIFRFAGRATTIGGQPVAGSEVWLECSEGHKGLKSRTDDAGRFQQDGRGWQPSSCVVRAHAAGYLDTAVPIMSVCKTRPWLREDACLEVAADPLVLTPSRPQ